ncbi:MAG: phage tail protein [Acidimicrobiia bacterium]
MRVASLTAEADLVGRRTRVRWTLVAEGDDDSVTGEPDLVLLGKARDFEYGDDLAPHVVHDAATFPPASGPDLDVVELRREPVPDGDRRVLVDVVTVSARGLPVPAEDPGGPAAPPGERPDEWTEVARRTRTTVVGPDGRILARTDEILDAGPDGAGLTPLSTRYYELRGPLVAASAGRTLRAVATPTDVHLSGRQLYEMIPGVWRRHDVPPSRVGPATGRIGAIPESRQDSGQLRRFTDLWGLGTDHLRSRADGLAVLHDVEEVDHRHLVHLAHLVGWELGPDAPVNQQRHEIRYAAQLYRMTGTLPGVQLWAKRLTSWDVEVKEFAENVIFSNDPGGELSPTRSGSSTVDTSDPELLASFGTSTDRGDFTYDTGTGPDDRYSSHTIGIFATLDPEDRVEDVARKRDRLVAASDRYLPANLRVVVVLPNDPVASEDQDVLGVSASTDDEI